ncbi:YraN family protein [Actinocorallia sp. A-T 12471]|uniref:YraN family protein n=1 Tax=Actinocorallia sp. A-T 12471 TaxID=3089813 RepID=UPI0029CE8E0D|nr:YraN family protein [Actinocorallia sp. A-T 12471]MDX6739128.1 YraN family protein [Actinocorallia sp. A-T 12471]
MNANHELGRRGEEAATVYLRRLGWQVLDRNWRCPEGELDIVALEGRTHVFCEVKTRRDVGFGHPAEALTPVKARRLRRLALRWSREHGVRAAGIRIDLIGLVGGGPAGFTVEHLREVA